MRRLLRDISEQRQLGDVTTLANADIVSEIAEMAAASHERGLNRTTEGLASSHRLNRQRRGYSAMYRGYRFLASPA